MAYFPHSFEKVLIGVPTGARDEFLATAGALTTTITPGQIALVDSLTNRTLDVTAGVPAYATTPMIYLAQGSFHTVDSLGSTFHGGYQETIKTKGINPKYVSKFYVTVPAAPINEIWSVCADGCALDCEHTYRLRIDIKGSPMLRALQRNMYFTVDGYTGCCSDPDSPAAVDPNVVLLQWMDRINEYPLVSPFVRASVWNDVLLTATAEASADAFITVTERTGILAGMKVVFTSTTANTTGAGATGSYIIGNTLTLGTVAANGAFSVGQTISGAGVLTGTKIVSRVSGDGSTGSVFIVDKWQNVGAAGAGVAITSTSPLIMFVDSTYVAAAGAGNVALVVANTPYSASTTATAVITTDALTAVDFYQSITTTGYTPATGNDVADVESCLIVESAYVDTQFGQCSFDPTDHYEIEPLEINLSVVDETGDPCVVSCMTETELQQAQQGKGYGMPLLKEYILSKRYEQEDYQYDPRMREVMNNTVLTDLDPTQKYVVYHILHSVPRKSNSDGMLDNDQYLYKIITTARDAGFETWMNLFLAGGYSEVRLTVQA